MNGGMGFFLVSFFVYLIYNYERRQKENEKRNIK